MVVKELSYSEQMPANWFAMSHTIAIKTLSLWEQGSRPDVASALTSYGASVCSSHLTPAVSQLSPSEFLAFVNILYWDSSSTVLADEPTSSCLSLSPSFQNTSSSTHSSNLMLPLHWVKSSSIYWNTATLFQLTDTNASFHCQPALPLTYVLAPYSDTPYQKCLLMKQYLKMRFDLFSVCFCNNRKDKKPSHWKGSIIHFRRLREHCRQGLQVLCSTKSPARALQRRFHCR